MSMLFYPPGSDFQSAILEDAWILVHAQWGLPQGASVFGRDLDDASQVDTQKYLHSRVIPKGFEDIF